MHDNQQTGVHWGFWLVGLLALLWNLMGAINFVMQMDRDAIASYPESHRAIIEGRPAWATGGFAIGVFAGTLGCLLLLLRKNSRSTCCLYRWSASWSRWFTRR